MSRPDTQQRAPQRIEAISQIQPGDIILFRKNPVGGAAQNMIERLQGFSNLSNGHNDTTHVAICTGKASDAAPLITHVTESRQLSQSFMQEPITDMLARDGCDRCMYIARHHDPEVQQRCSAVASKGGNYKWRSWVAASTLFTPNKIFFKGNSEEATVLSKNSVCSQFAAQVMNSAIELTNQQLSTSHNKLPYTTLTPKGLEHYLRDTPGFQWLQYNAQQASAYYYLACQTENKLKRLGSNAIDSTLISILQRLKALLHWQPSSTPAQQDRINDIHAQIDSLENTMPQTHEAFSNYYNPDNAEDKRRRKILQTACSKCEAISSYFESEAFLAYTAEPAFEQYEQSRSLLQQVKDGFKRLFEAIRQLLARHRPDYDEHEISELDLDLEAIVSDDNEFSDGDQPEPVFTERKGNTPMV